MYAQEHKFCNQTKKGQGGNTRTFAGSKPTGKMEEIMRHAEADSHSVLSKKKKSLDLFKHLGYMSHKTFAHTPFPLKLRSSSHYDGSVSPRSQGIIIGEPYKAPQPSTLEAN